MKRQINLISLLIITYYLIIPFIIKESVSYTSNNIKDVFITNDPYIGFYGNAFFNNEFDFICSTSTQKVGNPGDLTIMHYSIQEEGKVERKAIIQEEASFLIYDNYFSLTSTNKLYFAYQDTIRNESTGEFMHYYYCYYYNIITKEKNNFLLEDLNNYSSFVRLTGIRIQNNEVLFLLYDSHQIENATKITTKIVDENEIKETNTSMVLGCSYSSVLSCYSNNKKLAYFLFDELKNSKFHLYTYNYTSRMFSLHSAFNYTTGMITGFRSGGTLLFDETSDSLYFVCPKISLDETFNFVLYHYNSTLSTFEFVAEKNDCFASEYGSHEPIIYQRTTLSSYDTFINGSEICLLYQTSIAHADLYDIMFLKYSINTAEWERVQINKNSLPLYYSSFLYNATDQTHFLDSLFICYSYEGSDYRTFTRNNVLTAFAFFGEYEYNQLTPYLLRVVPATIFWVTISSIIVGSIIVIIGLVIGIRLLVKKIMKKK